MKRSRVEESRYVSIWARLVTKLIFVMIRLSELALDLLGERRKKSPIEEEDSDVETDPEDAEWESVPNRGRNKVFTLWTTPAEEGSPSIRTMHSPSQVQQTPVTTSEEMHSISYRPSPGSPTTPSILQEPTPTPKTRPIPKNKNRKEPSKEIEEKAGKPGLIDPENCQHTQTTKRGTNAFVLVEKCLQCNKTLKSERKSDAPDTHIKTEVKKEIQSMGETDEEKSEEFKEFLEYQKWKSQKDRQK